MKELYDKDSDKVAQFVEEFFADEQKYKQPWAQQARTWVAFANGDQNPYPYAAPIIVNNNPSNYSSQNDSRQNMYQGDELEAIIRTLVSYMTRQRPTVNAEPVSDDQDSKNIARVSRRVLDAKYQIDNEQLNSEKVATNGLVIGTVFGKDYWDYSKGGYIIQQDEMGQPIVDPYTGEPQYAKAGNNATSILTPLTISLDHSITDFDLQPIIIESYVVDVSWAQEAFNQDKPGYTGNAEKVREDGLSASTLRVHEEMKFAIPYVTWGTQYRTKGKCVVQEVYIRPGRSYPRGRMLIIAGGVVVYDSALTPQNECPYFLEEEEGTWHPYTCFKYEEFIGRFLGKSLIEGLIPLQMRLNEINGSILENANTLAKPNIAAAVGQLRKGITNGRGANVYTYNIVPGASPPYILEGKPLPEQFFKERQQIIEQMVRKAGTNLVMQGQPPPGVSAAAAIEQLLENANTQQSRLMQSFAQFHEKRFTKKLRFIHKFMQYPDPILAKYLKTIDKDALNEEIQDFVGARDLSDGVTINIEPGSMIPKSRTHQTQVYMDLAKQGALGPALTEDSARGEKLRTQILEKLDLDPLETEEGIELKKAKWENERIMRMEAVEVSPYDNPQIHLPCHIAKIQDPLFLENATDEQKIGLDNHIKEHQAIEAQKSMAAQQQQMPMQPSPMNLNSVKAPPGMPEGLGAMQ